MNQKSQIEMNSYGTSEGVEKSWDTRGRGGKKYDERIHQILLHALVKHDKMMSKRSSFNPHALPLYLEALDGVRKDAGKGKSLRDALTANFSDKLLDKLLKSVGEAISTSQEQGWIKE